jgi:hypothetical protein
MLFAPLDFRQVSAFFLVARWMSQFGTKLPNPYQTEHDPASNESWHLRGAKEPGAERHPYRNGRLSQRRRPPRPHLLSVFNGLPNAKVLADETPRR